MPFVLRNKENQLVASAMLINIYKFEYWGAKVWEERAEAEAETAGFLEANELGEPSAWELVEVEESKVKMINVKLNNDPRRRVTMDEQLILKVIK